MYLYERLIGVFTFCFFLILFFLLIYQKKIKVRTVLIFYLITLSILAFFYIPPETEDLYRIFQIVRNFEDDSIEKLFLQLKSTSYPIAMFFYYIVGKIGILGLIPSITVFITYGNIFNIVNNSVEKYELDEKKSAWLLMFAMSTGMFGYLVTNIRALLALSIIARCFFNEFIKDKKMMKNIIYYIIAFFIHPVSIFVIGFRMVYYFVLESKTKLLSKLCILVFIFISFVFLK